MAKRTDIFDMTNGKCFYCGCTLDINDFHIDHFVPKSSGGTSYNNLVPACPDCNLAKGCLSIDEFRDKLSKLPFDNHKGRMIAKYFSVTEQPVKFYFEEQMDGDL